MDFRKTTPVGGIVSEEMFGEIESARHLFQHCPPQLRQKIDTTNILLKDAGLDMDVVSLYRNSLDQPRLFGSNVSSSDQAQYFTELESYCDATAKRLEEQAYKRAA